MRNLKIILLSITMLSIITTAMAWPEILNGFNKQYGTSKTNLDKCEMCHTSRTLPACNEVCHNGKPEKITNLNNYGLEVKKVMHMKMDKAFKSIENKDSGDGHTYIEKIKNLTLPNEKIKNNNKKILESPSMNMSFFKRFFGFIPSLP